MKLSRPNFTAISLSDSRLTIFARVLVMIDKIRYLVKSGEHIFEVDEFYGENEGLTVAEAVILLRMIILPVIGGLLSQLIIRINMPMYFLIH